MIAERARRWHAEAMRKKDADGDYDGCTPTSCPKPQHATPHAPTQNPGQHHGPAHTPMAPVQPEQGKRRY